MHIEEIRFSDVLKKQTLERPDEIALLYRDTAYTFRNLAQAAELCAGDLIRLGVKPGDHVALWGLNSVNWVVAYLGIIRAGGVAVLAPYAASMDVLEKLLTFTDVKCLVYGDSKAVMADENAPQNLASSARIGLTYDIRPMDYLRRLAEGETSKTLQEDVRDSHETATIIFTTGTSGIPKAVQQSQYAFLNNARFCDELAKKGMGHRIFLALPLFHSYGLQVMAVCLCGGRTLCIAEDFSPNALAESLLKMEADGMFSVGVVYFGLMEHPEFEKEIAPRMRFCGIGGGFSTPTQMVHLSTAFSNAVFLCGYGQTEACTLISLTCPGDSMEQNACTVGRPIPWLEVQIWDTKTGQLPDGKTGEVVVRGCSIMNGYYKLPPEQQAVDSQGWLHTGDLGWLDEDGFLHLAGRLKDIIIKKGENLSPSQIESKIAECSNVLEVKVFGAPHPVFGESVEACIVPVDPHRFDEEVLRKELKDRLSSFETPSHFFSYPAFPLNVNGKLDQYALQSDMLERLKALQVPT